MPHRNLLVTQAQLRYSTPPLQTPPPQAVPLDHASYDAGLLCATNRAHEEIAKMVLLGEKGCHPDQVRLWHVPWYIATKQSYPLSIADFRKDTVTRLRAVLREKGFLSDAESRDAGIFRFLEHWAHVLLRESLPLHNRAYENLKLPDPASIMLLQTRKSLRMVLGNDRRIVAESPVHPHWNRRGHMWQTQHEQPIWVSEATASAQNFAAKVLGPHPGVEKPSRCFAAEVAAEAVPQLLSCDHQQYIEYAMLERNNIRHLLEGHEMFTQELRESVIEQLTDVWYNMNEPTSVALSALQRDGAPNILDGDTAEIFDAYITPILQDLEHRMEELERYIPLMTYLTFRSLLNKEYKTVEALAIAWNNFAVFCNLSPRIIGPVFLATTLIDSSRTPQEILNNNVL